MSTELVLIITPDPEDPECATVEVEAEVAGEPRRLIVDTGAGRSSLLSRGAVADLPSLGAGESGGLFGSTPEDLVRCELRLGDLVHSDMEVGRVSADEGRHDLLGNDVLASYRCLFRFGDQRLVLSTDSADDGRPLYLNEASHPHLEIRIGAETFLAVWDSGAGITIVDPSLLDLAPSAFTDESVSMGTDATGSRLETPTWHVHGLAIDQTELGPHKVATLDLSMIPDLNGRPVRAILGYPTLSQADWVIDYPAQRFSLFPI